MLTAPAATHCLHFTHLDTDMQASSVPHILFIHLHIFCITCTSALFRSSGLLSPMLQAHLSRGIAPAAAWLLCNTVPDTAASCSRLGLLMWRWKKTLPQRVARAKTMQQQQPPSLSAASKTIPSSSWTHHKSTPDNRTLFHCLNVMLLSSNM